jgi:hypothetical protein
MPTELAFQSPVVFRSAMLEHFSNNFPCNLECEIFAMCVKFYVRMFVKDARAYMKTCIKTDPNTCKPLECYHKRSYTFL